MKNHSVKNLGRRQFIQQGTALTGALVIGMQSPFNQ